MTDFTKTKTYNQASDFGFNTSLIAVTTAAALKSIKPAGARFYAGFHVDLDGEYGSGPSLAATGHGNPTTVSGMLDLTHSDSRYLDWPAQGNADFAQTGTVRFKITPNYSGAPASDQSLFTIAEAVADITNLIDLSHLSGSGLIELRIAGVGNKDFAAWSPTSGTTYEIEVDIDITNGITRLFIDGVQSGSTYAGTGTRTATSTLLRVGADFNGNKTSNFKITDFIVFDSVQHVTGFASEIPRTPETVYSTASPSITETVGVALRSIVSLSESDSEPSNTSVTYAFVDEDDASYYWNGSAVAAADGTVAKSSSGAVVSAHLAAFSAALLGKTVRLRAFLSSTLGNQTPTLTGFVMTYHPFFAEPAAPSTCIVYGWVKDILGLDNVTGVEIKARLTEPFFSGNHLIEPCERSTSPDSTGFFEFDLVVSAPKGRRYQFSASFLDGDGSEVVVDLGTPVSVPSQTSIALSDILSP